MKPQPRNKEKEEKTDGAEQKRKSYNITRKYIYDGEDYIFTINKPRYNELCRKKVRTGETDIFVKSGKISTGKCNKVGSRVRTYKGISYRFTLYEVKGEKDKYALNIEEDPSPISFDITLVNRDVDLFVKKQEGDGRR